MLKSVLIVYDFARTVGGISRVAAAPARYLIESGISVYLLTADNSPADLYPEEVEQVTLSKAGNTRTTIGERALLSIWNRSARATFARILTTFDPKNTVVHFHGWGMALSGSVAYEAISRGFKTVYTAHDYSLLCGNGVYYDFKQDRDCLLVPNSLHCLISQCDKLGRISKLQRSLRKFVDEKVHRLSEKFDLIVCVSTVVKDVLKSLGIDESRLLVIENPPSLFFQKVNPEENDTYLYVGRLTPEKGVDDLCKAANQIGAKVTLCGDGWYREELMRRFPEVKITGWVNQSELEENYRQARSLVLPSKWRETSGLVVDEAVSMGIPVIASDGTGAAEKVKRWQCGMVFRRGDVESLTSTLKRFDDTELVRQFSSNCQDKAAVLITTLERYSDSLLNTYSKLIDFT